MILHTLLCILDLFIHLFFLLSKFLKNYTDNLQIETLSTHPNFTKIKVNNLKSTLQTKEIKAQSLFGRFMRGKLEVRVEKQHNRIKIRRQFRPKKRTAPHKIKEQNMFDMKQYYNFKDTLDYLKLRDRINTFSNYTKEMLWENLANKDQEIVGIRLQNLVNPEYQMTTRDFALKIFDSGSREVVFSTYTNLGGVEVKYYTPGPYIWLNGDSRDIQIKRGVQSQDIHLEVQGGSLEKMDIAFQLNKIDKSQNFAQYGSEESPNRVWDLGFSSNAKDYFDPADQSTVSSSGVVELTDQSKIAKFSPGSGFEYDQWATIYGFVSEDGSGLDIHKSPNQSWNVGPGLHTDDVFAKIASPSPKVTPTNPYYQGVVSNNQTSSSSSQFLGKRSANQFKIFLNTKEIEGVQSNNSPFKLDDRAVSFSPQAPLFDLYQRQIEELYVFKPYLQFRLPWDFSQISLPSFDEAYLLKHYGRESLKKAVDPTPVAPAPSICLYTVTGNLDLIIDILHKMSVSLKYIL